MRRIDSMNLEGKGKGSRSGFDYLLGVLRGIFTSGDRSDELRGSDFTNAIIDRFRESYVLEDIALGTWFATLLAVDSTEDSASGEFEARFLLSRKQCFMPQNVWDKSVNQEISVARNYNEPLPHHPETLILNFSFSDMLPIRQNLQFFSECAISRLKNLQEHPLQYEMKSEESVAGAMSMGRPD
jgi:hypothetical protein